MKYFILLSACVVATFALEKEFIETFMGRVQKAAEECKAQTKVPDSDITLMLDKKVPATHEGKCMVACMHKEFRVQNAEGKLDKAGAMQEMEKIKHDDATYTKSKAVLDHCMGTVKDEADNCETAAKYMECGLAKAKEVNLDESVLGL